MIWRHVGHVGVSALSRLCDSLNRTLCLSFLSVSESFEISCDVFHLFCFSPDNFCSFCWRHFVLLRSSPYVHFHSFFLSCDRIPLWCKGIKILWNLTLCSQLSSASNLNRPSLKLTSLSGLSFSFLLEQKNILHFSDNRLFRFEKESDQKNLILWALLGVYKYYLDMWPDQTRLALPLQRRGRYERLWEKVGSELKTKTRLKRNSLRNKHEQVQQIQL